MSYAASDATAQAAAKAAASHALHQAARSGANDRAASSGSGSFDELLDSIPDAPPEPRAPARADAPPPERPKAPESRASGRNERADRSQRADNADRKAAPDDEIAPADDAAPKDATAAQTDKAVTETKPAGDDTKSATDGTEKPADETKTAETAATTQTAAGAMVPQAVVIDPVATAAAATPAADGDKTAKAATADAKAATTAAAATPTTAEQQAAALADQTTGLTADDAEALSALAAKAQQALKDGQGDKAGRKIDSDKPAHAAKPSGEAAPVVDPNAQAQSATADTDKSGAKPVQSDLAKLGTEHQRNGGNADAKPAADNAALAANANAAAVKGADVPATQTFSPVAHTMHAATGATAVTAPARAIDGDKPVPLASVAVEVTAKIASGKNQFDIRLDPEELGRIHVKVSVDRDGNISTHMMADRPETLDLMRRDIQGLERALQDAGLKTSDNGLQFSLRDQSANQQQDRQDGQASRHAADDDQVAMTPITVAARDYGRYGISLGGLDIRV